MEIELKYNIDSKELMDKIWTNTFFAEIEEEDSRGTTKMKAAYYDTADHDLMKNGLAFRIRLEGDRCIGTLKYRDRDKTGDGQYASIDGLYAREEINVPISSKDCFICPDTAMFQGSEEGKKLIEISDGKELICLFETIFVRRNFRIDTDDTICEVSLDEGEIIAGEKRAEIHELEIELFSGKEEVLLKIGSEVESLFDLKPEPLSKYARGKRLVAGESQ